MASNFKPAVPGEDLSLRADEWNDVREIALPQARQQRMQGGPRRSLVESGESVLVKNTGAAVARFGAVEITGFINSPEELTDEQFKASDDVLYVAAATGAAGRRWGVALQPLRTNEIGLVRFSGIVKCRINLTNVAHLWLTIKDHTIPTSVESGGEARILFVAGDAGSAASTGEQWAVVEVGVSEFQFPPAPFKNAYWGAFGELKIAGWGHILVPPLGTLSGGA